MIKFILKLDWACGPGTRLATGAWPGGACGARPTGARGVRRAARGRSLTSEFHVQVTPPLARARPDVRGSGLTVVVEGIQIQVTSTTARRLGQAPAAPTGRISAGPGPVGFESSDPGPGHPMNRPGRGADGWIAGWASRAGPHCNSVTNKKLCSD